MLSYMGGEAENNRGSRGERRLKEHVRICFVSHEVVMSKELEEHAL